MRSREIKTEYKDVISINYFLVIVVYKQSRFYTLFCIGVKTKYLTVSVPKLTPEYNIKTNDRGDNKVMEQIYNNDI
jgi:hypothetical protein